MGTTSSEAQEDDWQKLNAALANFDLQTSSTTPEGGQAPVCDGNIITSISIVRDVAPSMRIRSSWVQHGLTSLSWVRSCTLVSLKSREYEGQPAYLKKAPSVLYIIGILIHIAVKLHV